MFIEKAHTKRKRYSRAKNCVFPKAIFDLIFEFDKQMCFGETINRLEISAQILCDKRTIHRDILCLRRVYEHYLDMGLIQQHLNCQTTRRLPLSHSVFLNYLWPRRRTTFGFKETFHYLYDIMRSDKWPLACSERTNVDKLHNIICNVARWFPFPRLFLMDLDRLERLFPFQEQYYCNPNCVWLKSKLCLYV